ncbi:hypothetical protein D7Y13_20165 [Corallococcus praedator]|uniref:AbiV family abortive infection protein n=1 Tax=Corallococcus praedator TaxID=2316724 RepID=A0ABX9QFE3_9BACT|nr:MULTISPECIES: immunity 49 family protein [Corallococcus]RKH26920.1 hypothetical protein D7X75_27470 [Corallococcus sp. CA031C]RKI06453.1 hypothetical protein D7Y13_20165 [Corallococcus praedator]
MSELASLLINSRHRIQDALASIEATDTEESSGFAYVKLAYAYRTLAMCQLLLQADAQAFSLNLRRSAQTTLQFFTQLQLGRDFNPVHSCASRVFSFTDALVAGDLPTARELGQLLPTHHDPRIEYEDDFLLPHCMGLMLLAPPGQEATLVAALARWRTVLEGGADPYLDALHALLGGEGNAFDDALERLIHARGQQFAQGKRDMSIDEETQLTEGRLFMKGLALLRLAEVLGLETQQGYVMMPSLARPPLATLPLPPHAWKSPGLA